MLLGLVSRLLRLLHFHYRLFAGDEPTECNTHTREALASRRSTVGSGHLLSASQGDLFSVRFARGYCHATGRLTNCAINRISRRRQQAQNAN